MWGMTEEFEVKIGRVSLEGFSTAELVAELSKRDEVGYHIIRNSFEIKRGICESPKLESHWQEVKYDGPITVLVVRE